jgi:branched-chain amino acid transport system ATP-binding protein
VTLSVQDLRAGYGSSQVLFGVDMHVAEGETVALIGRNGAGKTTTLHCVMGVLGSRQGSIEVNGAQTIRLSPHRIARLGVALVPQGRRVFSELTVEENLRTGIGAGRRRSGGGAHRKDADGRGANAKDADGSGAGGRGADGSGASGRGAEGRDAGRTGGGDAGWKGAGGKAAERGERWTMDELFEVFPLLAKVRKSKGAWLSGGEQQVLSIARALITHPRMLLLDEPTEGLAPRVVETLTEQLLRVKASGLTIILAEQHLGLVRELASRAYVIDRGLVRAEGEPGALLADEQIRHAYLSL